MKIILIVVSATIVALAGCGAISNAMKPVNLFKVNIGMSKADVVRALEKDPDNVVGAKEYDDGIMEVIQYSGYTSLRSANANELEAYWLYFFNDRLIEWGAPPPDWEVYVERIYEKRQRE